MTPTPLPPSESMDEFNFPPGLTYVLVVETDSYSGNFERELSAYVAGAYDSERGHGGTEAEQFLSDAAAEDWAPVAASMRSAIKNVLHDEYGYCCCGMRRVPTAAHPSGEYNAVVVFLTRPLGAEEMSIVRKRARDYCAAYTPFMSAPAPMQLLDVYQTSVMVHPSTEMRLPD